MSRDEPPRSADLAACVAAVFCVRARDPQDLLPVLPRLLRARCRCRGRAGRGGPGRPRQRSHSWLQLLEGACRGRTHPPPGPAALEPAARRRRLDAARSRAGARRGGRPAGRHRGTARSRRRRGLHRVWRPPDLRGGPWFVRRFLQALGSTRMYTSFTIDSPSLADRGQALLRRPGSVQPARRGTRRMRDVRRHQPGPFASAEHGAVEPLPAHRTRRSAGA